MVSNQDIRVGVIGAGVSGIVSVKECLEAGFQVTCFDKSPHFGGLWKFNDDASKTQDTTNYSIPSVMKTTIMNTSKELSAFSDFPPPAHLPNFMKHHLYMDYIKSYAEHFNVVPHIKLEHKVLRCEPNYSILSRTFNWLVHVLNLKTNEKVTYTFEKLIIAIGHHNIPFTPTFSDQEKFKGQIIHSVNVKDVLNDKRFIDKKVVIVGFGNSACDAANDVAVVASKCYVSSHRGNWLIGRLNPKGPHDFEYKTKWNHFRSKMVPSSVVDSVMIGRIKSRINHKLLGLTPKHKPSEQVPVINDLFPFRIFTGSVVLKGSIERFTEEGVIFEGEKEQVYETDIVILATGYKAEAKFLDEHKLGLKSNEYPDDYELFLNMFAPKLTIFGLDSTPCDIIESLAFIGLSQPSGSITVISELQARYAALVFQNKLKLPTVNRMVKAIEVARNKRVNAIRSHSRDQLAGPWIAICEDIASLMDSKPNLVKLFFIDFVLWKKLMFGPSVSYQYRLRGPGSWEEARETILTVKERFYCGINEGKNPILFKTRRKRLGDHELTRKIS